MAEAHVNKLLTWIVLLPVAVVVVAFTIANRGAVTVSLEPLPLRLGVPLYAVAMASVLVGVVAGGAAAWARGRKWRRLARARRRQLERLEGELEGLRPRAAGSGPPEARGGGLGFAPGPTGSRG